MTRPRATAAALLSLALWLATAAAAGQGLQVTSTAFVPDRAFPELLLYFREGWSLRDELGQVKQYTDAVRQGATLHLFLRNTSSRPLEVTRVLLDGINLAEQLAPVHREHGGLRASSFLLNDETLTPPALRQRLEALGAPVWWQVRPNPVPSGGFSQLVVRLRTMPEPARLELRVGGDAEDLASARLDAARPAALSLASVSFGGRLDRLFAYVRRDDGEEFKLRSVQVDGREVRRVRPVGAASLHGFLPLEIRLPDALAYGSFHHVAVTTVEGDTAAAVVRVRDPLFSLGMWGYRNDGLTLEEMVRDCCTTFRDHLFNTHMGMAGKHTGYLESGPGLELLQDTGLRLMAHTPASDNARHPQLYARFLLDEPDCRDYVVDQLPWDRRIGSYAQALVERQREWTDSDPRTLSLLNVDMTFKPENWLTYGQLADIFAVDPYYQNRLRDAYWSHPGWLAQFSHPYYVHAVSEVARSACQPHPLHLILNSTSYHEGEDTFRYGTPEEKRIEFYYALAAGASGISYWWFTPYGTHRGCGATDAAAHAMMQELARLNAEARAVEPLLALACPAAAPGQPDPFTHTRPDWLIARTLFAGTDAALIVLINRDHACDRLGTVYQPLPQARVTFRLPPWMQAAHALRLSGEQVETLSLAAEGESVTAELSDIELTELLVITGREELAEQVARDWRQLLPRLEAVTERTFDEYAADRGQAAEQRAAELARRRQALFGPYLQMEDETIWVQPSERLGTYGYETEEIWNPTDTKYNAQTWWVARGEVTADLVRGLRWRPPAPGRYRVAISYLPARDYRLRLVAGSGEVTAEMHLPEQFPAHPAVAEWVVELPEGALLEFVQLGRDAGGEMWGRVSALACFLPAAAE